MVRQYSSSRGALAERERRLPAFRDGGGQRPWTPLYLECEYEHDRGLQHIDLAAGGDDSVRGEVRLWPRLCRADTPFDCAQGRFRPLPWTLILDFFRSQMRPCAPS